MHLHMYEDASHTYAALITYWYITNIIYITYINAYHIGYNNIACATYITYITHIIQIDRQADRQTGRQTGRQTDR